jgi:SRSO17 transposase
MFKPKGTLKPSEQYKTKIDWAGEIITELIDYGFQIEFVLADSLYSESSQFIKILDKYKLPYIVSIRSNHGVWLTCDQRVRANKWCKFEGVFSDGKLENRALLNTGKLFSI